MIDSDITVAPAWKSMRSDANPLAGGLVRQPIARDQAPPTDTQLTEMLENIGEASGYLREVESDMARRERRLVAMHARMRTLIEEANERVRAADARAEEAEARMRTLEQWTLSIADLLVPANR